MTTFVRVCQACPIGVPCTPACLTATKVAAPPIDRLTDETKVFYPSWAPEGAMCILVKDSTGKGWWVWDKRLHLFGKTAQ